jgi:hypothetical protein
MNGIALLEATMSSDDDSDIPGISIQPTAETDPDSFAIARNAIGNELDVQSSESCSVCKEVETGQRTSTKAMFRFSSWHKPYAEALMETDPHAQRDQIKAAEQAILIRFLEIHAASPPAQEYESNDLQNAVTALTQLKNPNSIP